MSRIRLMATMALACISIGGSGSARGEFLVGSNLGVSSPFDPSNTYALSGNYSSSGVGFNYAVRFTQEGTGSATFQQAQLALSYRGGMNLIDVVLMADNGGIPGQTLETIHLYNGVPPYSALVTVTSALNPTLVGGQDYWLAVVASGDTEMTWAANVLGQTGHMAYQRTMGSVAESWLAAGNLDPAYAVTSLAVGPTGAVPEPSGLAMCAMSGLIWLGSRWGRGRA